MAPFRECVARDSLPVIP